MVNRARSAFTSPPLFGLHRGSGGRAVSVPTPEIPGFATPPCDGCALDETATGSDTASRLGTVDRLRAGPNSRLVLGGYWWPATGRGRGRGRRASGSRWCATAARSRPSRSPASVHPGRHRHRDAHADEDVADREHVGERQPARQGEPVDEPRQGRVDDPRRRTPRSFGPEPAAASASGVAGMTPPLARIATRLRPAPTATIGRPVSRMLRTTTPRTTAVEPT